MSRKAAPYTPAEYLALEQTAAYKSEYYAGEIFAMAGGSPEHSRIGGNVFGELFAALKGRPCQPYNSDLMVTVATGLRTYPDVSVVCGPLERDPEVPTAVTNPAVIFEVISPSTEAYDRGVKTEHYQKIASLRTLVLVASTHRHIEVRERQPDGSWILRSFVDGGEIVPLTHLSTELSVDAIYEGVDLRPGDPIRPVR